MTEASKALGLPSYLIPSWLQVAAAELGVKETPGPASTPRVQEYLMATRGAGPYDAPNDETPWCSAFVNWCMTEVGAKGTGSLAARSWMHWGCRLDEPIPGCVVVLWRGAAITSGLGHVGLYVRHVPQDVGKFNPYPLALLGGNQGDSVSIQEYPASRVLGYRWPR